MAERLSHISHDWVAHPQDHANGDVWFLELFVFEDNRDSWETFL